jgi:transcriptional regulator with XRE-family HTH domain
MVSSSDLLRLRVRTLLERSGRTRKNLARYLGKTPSWATDYLNGRHNVSINDLDRLARFFGVTVSSLFDRRR